MSTGGFIAVRIGGALKATYNHSDSYPGGLGLDVLHWLQKNLIDGKLDVEVLGVLAGLELVDEAAEPTAKQIAKLNRAGIMKPQRVSTEKDFYAWLRTTQGDIDATLRSGFMTDCGDFVDDEAFCEWGYIIDVDASEFVVTEHLSKVVDRLTFADVAEISDDAFIQRVDS